MRLTDEVDRTTPEERNALAGYCEEHDRWFKFTRGVHLEQCPICKKKFSSIPGFQIITQRTFKETTKKPKKR